MNILQECNDSNVDELEIYWIKKMRDNGCKLTNLSNGGEFVVDWNGKKHTNEAINKIKESKIKYYKPVIQYDLNGNILNEYLSLTEASKKSGLHIYLISNCCKKKGQYTIGGRHFWRNKDSNSIPTTFRYKSDPFDYIPYDKIIQKNSIKICKYNTNGEIVSIYDSIRSAALENNTNKSNISSCCKRKINKKNGDFIVVKGFTYRYFEETNGLDLIFQIPIIFNL